MPRVKATKKSATKATELLNGVGKSLKAVVHDAVVSSTTNGSNELIGADAAVAGSTGEAIVAAAVTKVRGRQKKTIEAVIEKPTETAVAAKSLTTAVTGGRGRKKVTTPVLPETVENGDGAEVQAPALDIEVPKLKGRGKKSAPKIEVKAAVEETLEKPKAKGRVKKSNIAVIAEVEAKNENNDEKAAEVLAETKPIKAVKSTARGRKKVEPLNQDVVMAEIDALPAVIQEEKEVPPKKRSIPKKSNTAIEELNAEETDAVEKPAVSKKKQKIEKVKKVAEKPIKEDKKTKTTSSEPDALLDASAEIASPAKPAARGKKRLLNPPAVIYADIEEENMESKIATEAQEVKKKRGGGRAAKAEQVPAEDLEQSTEIQENKPVSQRGRKRAAALNYAESDADATVADATVADAKPSKSKKANPSLNATDKKNATDTSYNKSDFDLPPLENGNNASDNVLEKRFNLKISSWNVAGLRSWVKKDGLKFLDYEEPDIFCMQETKCTTDQLPEEAERINGYHPYWLCMPGGYAGVAIYSKIMPINVEYGIGNKEFDDVGRLITAEYEKFFLICVYVPNSGRKLVSLEPRMRWEKLFQAYVQQLDARKPVVICGDMNVSHQEIDLANPKSNIRNAGFTKEERDKMSELLALGYVDTFRHLYPTRTDAYTFWTYMGNARARNVGWRLDYFLVSERLTKRVVENCMRSQCKGSDHCPITLFLKL